MANYSKRRKSSKVDTTVPKTDTMTLEKALDVFLKAQHAAGNSIVTQNNYKRVIGLFTRYMSALVHTSIDDIEEVDILEWLSHLRSMTSRRGLPLSSRSIETYSRDVSAFFRWLVEHNYLSTNPMGKIKSPKVEKALIRVFTEEDLHRLDAACERKVHGKSLTPDERKALAARDRAFLWLLLSTGIRVSEACGLLFSDIDWDSGMIYVRGKGAKERRIPFGKVARQHLNTYIQYWRGEPTQEGDEHVFLGAFGDAVRPSTVQVMFDRLKKVAGITDKRVSAHTCRHWFAVNCIKNGMPSVALQALLGHETLEMINTYVRLAEQDNRDLYATFSPVDRLDMHHNSKGKRERAREWRNSRKKDSKE